MLKIQQILRDENGKNLLDDCFDTILIKENCIITINNKCYGFYTRPGFKRVLSCEWDKIILEGDYIIASKRLKTGLWKVNGDKIIKPEWDKIILTPHGIIVIKEKKQGFFDYQGNMILNCEWKKIISYPKVLLAYPGNRKKVVFDYRGKVIEA